MNNLFSLDHPVHTLGYDEDSEVVTRLDVEVSGGGAAASGGDSLREWWANVTLRRFDDGGAELDSDPVAHMGLTVINEHLGNPLEDLDNRDGDSYTLGSALWEWNGIRTPEFGAASMMVGDGPVLLVDTFTVQDLWRGTPLTPLLACRILDAFSRLGVGVAALYASPMTDGGGKTDARVKQHIEAMWVRCGFGSLVPGGSVMWAALDPISLADRINEIAAVHPSLLAAIEEC